MHKPLHLFTTEILYHYTCGQCKNWWSYATTPRTYDTVGQWEVTLRDPEIDRAELTCPHCGHLSYIEKKK